MKINAGDWVVCVKDTYFDHVKTRDLFRVSISGLSLNGREQVQLDTNVQPNIFYADRFVKVNWWQRQML